MFRILHDHRKNKTKQDDERLDLSSKWDFRLPEKMYRVNTK